MTNKHQQWSGVFQSQVLSLLQERDQREQQGFSDLFRHHERLFENWAAVRSENLRLSMQVERGCNDRGGRGGHSEEREKSLEQKVLRLQEEVTALHRKRGENATHVLALSAKLTEKEAELELNRTGCAVAVARAADQEDQIKFLQSRLNELEATNELLRDEHQALHLAYTSLEDKHRKMASENTELLQRYIEVKGQHADIMNQENENFIKKRQAQVREELEDAATEMKTVVSEELAGPDSLVPSDVPYYSSLVCYCTVPTVPSKKREAHESEVNAIRWSPTGRHIATGGTDRKVKIWESSVSGIELKATLMGSNGSILNLDFDSAASLILSTSSDFACRIWSLEDSRLRHTLTGHSGKVLAARFIGDPTKVVSGSHDRTLKVWDLRSRACVSTKFAGSSCNDLVCLNDETTIISGHFDKRVRFWDVRKETPTQEVSLPGKITSLDLSVNQNYLLASVRDDSIEVLDLRMNSVIGQYSAEGFKMSSDFSRASFSPDGQFIACGSSDGSIYIFSVMENKLDSILKEHTAAVAAVHWHPQGIALVSGDRAKKIIVWTP